MSFEVARFGDLFNEPQRNGLTRPKKVRGTGLPMVNMGELFAYPRIRSIAMDLVPVDEKEHHYLLEAGDLLFARQSLVLSGAGQCSIFLGNDAPTVFESHLIRCRLNAIRSNPLFYFYFFRSPDGRRAIEAIVEQGAGASGIRGSDLVNVQVPNPPKQIQDEIAALLGSFDDRITLLRETNTTLETIAQALFKSWFVDFDPVHAKMQGRAPEGMDEATAALFPDSFEESELGPVPSGWRVEPLAQLFEFKEGPGIRNWQYTNSDIGTRFINIRCIQDGDLKIETANRISNEEANGKYAHFHLKAWDVVVSTSGTLGRSAIVRNEHLPLMLNTSVIRFSPIEGKTTFSYLYEYLNFPEFLYKLESMASGSVQKNFGPMHLKQISLLAPPFSVLLAFEIVTRPLFEKIVANRALVENISELRDALLPCLISGKLKLSEAVTSTR